jgi:hypothetical protein
MRLKNPSEDTYTENHHIFPKSLFGDSNVVVKLNAREHYIAHRLLYRIYYFRYGIEHPKTCKMLRSISFMSSRKGIRTNSRMYEECRKAQSIAMKGKNNPSVKYGFSEDHRRKLSEAGKIRKYTETHRENQRLAWKRRVERGDIPFSEETRRKSIEKRERRYNFIHTSGLEEFNLTAIELSNKYKEQNLDPSNLRGARGCSTKGYKKHKGWRINNNELEYFKSRKPDKRTHKDQ